MEGQEAIRGISVPSSQFCYGLKTALKKMKSLLKVNKKGTM